MQSEIKNLSVNPNSFIAAIWFILAGLMAATSIVALVSQVPLMFAPILLLSIVVFLIGCQLTVKLKMPDEKFKKSVKYIALAAVFASSFSIMLAGVSA